MSMNAHHCNAVLTEDREKAEWAFSAIEEVFTEVWGKVVNRRMTKNDMRLTFESGELLVWLKPSQELRGYRFHRLFADHELTVEYIRAYVLPYIRCSVDDIVWI